MAAVDCDCTQPLSNARAQPRHRYPLFRAVALIRRRGGLWRYQSGGRRRLRVGFRSRFWRGWDRGRGGLAVDMFCYILFSNAAAPPATLDRADFAARPGLPVPPCFARQASLAGTSDVTGERAGAG